MTCQWMNIYKSISIIFKVAPIPFSILSVWSLVNSLFSFYFEIPFALRAARIIADLTCAESTGESDK